LAFVQLRAIAALHTKNRHGGRVSIGAPPRASIAKRARVAET
jgi:hypothetical protein